MITYRLLLSILFILLLSACSMGKKAIILNGPEDIPSGHALVFLDVAIKGDRCGKSSYWLYDETHSKKYFPRGRRANHVFVPPGKYKVVYVSCVNIYVNVAPGKSIYEKDYKPSELMKSSLRSPFFSVSAGDVRHVGMINIKEVQKQILFKQGGKYILEPIALTEQQKSNLQERYPSLYPQMDFTLASSVSKEIFHILDKQKQAKN